MEQRKEDNSPFGDKGEKEMLEEWWKREKREKEVFGF